MKIHRATYVIKPIYCETFNYMPVRFVYSFPGFINDSFHITKIKISLRSVCFPYVDEFQTGKVNVHLRSRFSKYGGTLFQMYTCLFSNAGSRFTLGTKVWFGQIFRPASMSSVFRQFKLRRKQSRPSLFCIFFMYCNFVFVYIFPISQPWFIELFHDVLFKLRPSTPPRYLKLFRYIKVVLRVWSVSEATRRFRGRTWWT